MDHLVEDVLKMGFLDAHCEREEMTQFLGMMQRFAELLPQRSGVEKIGGDIVKIIVEETNSVNCSIVLWDQEMERLSLLSAFGVDDLLAAGPNLHHNKDLTFAPDEGIAGRAFSTRNSDFCGRCKPVYHSGQERCPSATRLSRRVFPPDISRGLEYKCSLSQ